MIKRVWAIYWSATGTTERVARAVAQAAAEQTGAPLLAFDFTTPAAREGFPTLNEHDLAVFATPTYAGRVPNLLLPYLRTVRGGGAAAVPVVTFGQRAFDDALAELTDLLTEGGFAPVAAGAFACAHSFSETLGAGRPDADDLAQAAALGRLAAEREENRGTPLAVPGRDSAHRTYYQPRDRHGNPIDIRKVKPKTSSACNGCGLCAAVCPMGSIDRSDPSVLTGVCIKCCACVKKCPTGAKYYDDAGYLYHKTELEEQYGVRRAENTIV